VRPFSIDDEWYFHMRFRPKMQGVVPLLTALPPATTMSRPDGTHSGNPAVREEVAKGLPQHLMWARQRPDGGRGFGFTGGHVHWNWAEPNHRRLVLNAVAWIAKVNVPKDGVPSKEVTLADLERNNDEEKPATFNQESVAALVTKLSKSQ
jgi:hypothetical protein